MPSASIVHSQAARTTETGREQDSAHRTPAGVRDEFARIVKMWADRGCTGTW